MELVKKWAKKTGREGEERVGRDQLNNFLSKIRYAHILVWRAYAALDVDPNWGSALNKIKPAL